MSRCFPYPPPGYARKVASTEAPLIESIKLQSERPGSKTDRKKEKSKLKKEKSEGKKHKSKDPKEKKSSRSHGSKQKEVKDLPKGTKVEAEQLERSGLTEEHGQPVWPQSPGYLSDGSQLNHKRKRDASLQSDGSQFNHKRKRDASLQPDEGCKPGKIIRFKLASSLSQHEGSSAGSKQICSTSGSYNSSNEKRDKISRRPVEPKTCFTNANTAVAVKDCIKQNTCFTIANKAVAVNDSIEQKNCFTIANTAVKVKDSIEQKNCFTIANMAVKVKDNIDQKTCFTIVNTAAAVKYPISEPKNKDPLSCAILKDIGTHQGNVVSLPPPRTRSRAESSYDALFEKWVPTPVQFELQTDDEEWLFGTRKQDAQTMKTNITSSSVPSCRSSSLWPKGQYLADADVYSLPYTIPF